MKTECATARTVLMREMFNKRRRTWLLWHFKSTNWFFFAPILVGYFLLNTITTRFENAKSALWDLLYPEQYFPSHSTMSSTFLLSIVYTAKVQLVLEPKAFKSQTISIS